MRTRPLRRLAAAIVNVLFLLAWGEPVGLHPCPTHDAVAAHHGHAATPAAAEHGDHATAPAGHACNCLGQCSAGVGIAAPTAQAVRWQVVVGQRAAPEHRDPDAPRAAADRLLPFANGPPRLA